MLFSQSIPDKYFTNLDIPFYHTISQQKLVIKYKMEENSGSRERKNFGAVRPQGPMSTTRKSPIGLHLVLLNYLYLQYKLPYLQGKWGRWSETRKVGFDYNHTSIANTLIRKSLKLNMEVLYCYLIFKTKVCVQRLMKLE